MKKLVLFIMAVMGFAGMSVAQDVYSSGCYTDANGTRQAAVYKNNVKLYNTAFSNGFYGDCTDVFVYEDDVYWVRNCQKNGTYQYGSIMKNNSEWLAPESSTDGSYIHDLYGIPELGLYAVGCKNNANAVRTAMLWENDNSNPLFQLGDGTWPSVAYGVTSDEDYSCLYSCGVQYGYEETSYHGVIWKGSWEGSSEFYVFPDGTRLYDIAYRDGFLWTIGTEVENGKVYLKCWITDVTNEMTDVEYTLSDDSSEDDPDRTKIFVDDAGDVYAIGVTPYYDRLFKNGEEINHTAGFYTSVVANANGVYYAGSTDDAGGYEGILHGRIWKDGEVIFSPSDCAQTTSIFIEELTCTNEEARPLPYYEGFETGNTDWACWYSEDVDGYNDNYGSYWHRVGERLLITYAANGDYCAMHAFGPDEYEQEGWLVSPLIRIPENGGDVKLTFNTAEYYEDDYEYEAVWVASESIPDGVELWVAAPDFVSPDWKEVELDLTAFKGMDIRVYFRYVGTYAHVWYVDDVSIKQEAGPASYTITTDVNPVGAGTVTGGGTYPEGTEVTLTAMANTGYNFSHWSDGLTTNPRTITVNANANYTAYFITGGGGTMYTVNVVSENPLLGSVSGGGTFQAGSVIQISATPSPSARFVSWDDEVTDNPRTITVTGDMTFKARFAALQNYTITVETANPSMGSVTGGGTFLEGTTISISATPFTGYYFTGWNDGNADNPRTITVTQNATYRAQFSANAVTTYTLTVLCDNAQGSVVGGGTYTAGAAATIAAIPNSGFEFDKWQDNVTENPRQVVVNGDMTYVAFFKGTGVGENEGKFMVLYPNPATDYVRLEGIEENSEVKIYDAMGALVKVVNVNAEDEIGISDLSAGLYLLRCGNASLRFVKE